MEPVPNLIYWTLRESREMPPDSQAFLSLSELGKLASFRFPKRRNEWLLGRWTAKSLVRSLTVYRDFRLDQIEIGNNPQGEPYFQLPGQAPSGTCLSISHSDAFAFCALAPARGLRVGADLEKIEARTETFVLDYFTPGERRMVQTHPPGSRAELVTLVWSIKEAMLKALGVGLRQDTRSVAVIALESAPASASRWKTWQGIRIDETQSGGHTWVGWWQRRDDFILSLAAFSTDPAGIQAVELVEQEQE